MTFWTGNFRIKLPGSATRSNTCATRLPALSKALGYEGHIERVAGLFISLADLRGFESADDSVTLWDYNGFLRRLRRVGLNPRLVDLLDRSHIVHSMSVFDLINEHPEVSS